MNGTDPPQGAESADNDGETVNNDDGDDSTSGHDDSADAATKTGDPATRPCGSKVATAISADDAVTAGSTDGVVKRVQSPIDDLDSKGAKGANENATARVRQKIRAGSKRKAKAKPNGKGRKDIDGVGRPTKRGKYDVVEPSVWRDVLLEYYTTDESELPTQVEFCRSRGLNRTTFRRYWRRSELCELKKRGKPAREAEKRLDAYLGTTGSSRGGGRESKKPRKETKKETKKKLALELKRKAKLTEARRVAKEKADMAKSRIWRDLLLEYYGNSHGCCSQAEFCRRKGLGSTVTFGEKWRESGLRDLRARGEPIELARRRVDAYLRIRDPPPHEHNQRRGEEQTDERRPPVGATRRDTPAPAPAPLATVNSEEVNVVVRGKYDLVKSEVWCDALVEFYEVRDEPMSRFCLRKELNRSTFRRHWSASNLQEHQKAGRPVQFARRTVEAYFEGRSDRLRDRLRRMHDGLQRRHDARTHGALTEQAKVTASRLRREHLQRTVLERINARVRTGRELGPSEFDDLCRLIREPFKYTTTDDRGFGVTVWVSGDDATACVPLASTQGAGASKKRRRSEVRSNDTTDGSEMDRCHSTGTDAVADSSDIGKRIKALRNLLGDFFKHKQDVAATPQRPPYYQPTAALSVKKLNMFLRIFTPHCGKICSSDKQAKVDAIDSLHLTQQMVDARIEDLTLELNHLLLAQEQAKANEDRGA